MGRIDRPCRSNLKRACPLPHGSMDLFNNNSVNEIGEMNQEVLGEATKHETLVVRGSFLARVPIAETDTELVMGEVLLKGDTAFLCPTVGGIDQSTVIGLRLHTLPWGDCVVVSICQSRTEDLLLQAHGTGGIDRVVHGFYRSEIRIWMTRKWTKSCPPLSSVLTF